MPFTVTHLLAVVPLARFCRWELFLALAIGAVTPDVSVIFRSLSYRQFHSASGLLYPCVPVGLVMYAFMRFVGVPFLVDLAPSRVHRRVWSYLENTRPMNAKSWVCIAAAVAFGSFTHVLWDSFTHSYGMSVRAFQILHNSVHLPGGDVPLYVVLQHGSSVIGLPILAWYGLNRWRRLKTPAIEETSRLGVQRKRLYAGLLLGLPVMIVGVQFALFADRTFRLSTVAVAWMRWSLVVFAVGASLHRGLRAASHEPKQKG